LPVGRVVLGSLVIIQILLSFGQAVAGLVTLEAPSIKALTSAALKYGTPRFESGRILTLRKRTDPASQARYSDWRDSPLNFAPGEGIRVHPGSD
jgi:hypothetical protein